MKLTVQNKLSGLILFMMMLFCSNVSAQDFTATGTVVDSEKEPLIGASVSVVGGKVGAITDIDGNFTIQCKQICLKSLMLGIIIVRFRQEKA
mgnify:CR=1 FL=1